MRYLEPVNDLRLMKHMQKPTKLGGHLREFLQTKLPVAKVHLFDGEYSSVESARNSYQRAVNILGLPIHVRVYKGELFFVRTDLSQEDLRG